MMSVQVPAGRSTGEMFTFHLPQVPAVTTQVFVQPVFALTLALPYPVPRPRPRPHPNAHLGLAVALTSTPTSPLLPPSPPLHRHLHLRPTPSPPPSPSPGMHPACCSGAGRARTISAAATEAAPGRLLRWLLLTSSVLRWFSARFTVRRRYTGGTPEVYTGGRLDGRVSASASGEARPVSSR